MSEQARHTPGPWRPDFDDEMGAMRLRSYRDSQACIIAIIRNNELDDELSGERYCMVEQARANARLIAAAPELLDELRVASCALSSTINDLNAIAIETRHKDQPRNLRAISQLAELSAINAGKAMGRIREAIAKATGGAL